jgi:hypothetical protein
MGSPPLEEALEHHFRVRPVTSSSRRPLSPPAKPASLAPLFCNSPPRIRALRIVLLHVPPVITGLALSCD